MRTDLRVLPIAALMAMSTACSSLQSRDEITTATTKDAKPAPTATGARPETSIDLVGLEASLGLQRPLEDLGYAERAFNSCEAGYGFSSSHDCRKLVLVVIQFQLQCRESEGTESTVNYAVSPIAGARVRWNLGTGVGFATTDGQGFGRLRWIASSSQQRQKLRLTHGNNFLILTAGDVRRIVTPGSWCRN